MARPARPEPKVFLSDELAERGADWYRATYFAQATAETLLGEKSTSYIEDPRAAERVKATLGPTEIVVLLRDPVERAVSNWRFSTDSGLENRSLEAALQDNLAGATAWDKSTASVSPFAYLERGRYDDYLDPWFSTFPSTTHVHFLDDLKHDDAAVQRIFAGLRVDAGFLPADRNRAVNQSRTSAPALSSRLLRSLREYFGPSDRALGRRLGRDLPWPTFVGGKVDNE